MFLGGLVSVGLDPDWLRGLPDRLGLQGIGVDVRQVQRAGIACQKADFSIPPQPHGRHLKSILQIVERSSAPASVKTRAKAVFQLIAEEEAKIHGIPVNAVHLHEVGAVDAILDVVGAVWGLHELGVSAVHCGPISLGDGFVTAEHGVLPVPAPATLRLLEGLLVRPGPPGCGELVTPTGAALVRVLSEGPPPASYVPLQSGFGAGTRELPGRANALRIILADSKSDGERVDHLVMLATDLDDMSPELLSATADGLLAAGALDVVLISTHMKKGRIGARLELLGRPADADRLERLVFERTTTLGLRRSYVERRALERGVTTVDVVGHPVRVKTAHLPNGRRRSKAEFEDVRAASQASGLAVEEVAARALAQVERE